MKEGQWKILKLYPHSCEGCAIEIYLQKFKYIFKKNTQSKFCFKKLKYFLRIKFPSLGGNLTVVAM